MNQNPGIVSSGLPVTVSGTVNLGTIGPAATEATLLGVAGFVTSAFDYLSVAYPIATTEVYTFKTGGSGGTTVATVTVVYTDSTKANLSTVTKT